MLKAPRQHLSNHWGANNNQGREQMAERHQSIGYDIPDSYRGDVGNGRNNRQDISTEATQANSLPGSRRGGGVGGQGAGTAGPTVAANRAPDQFLQYQPPRFPNYIDYETRLLSYDKDIWPPELGRKKEKLAKSGFFCTGIGDSVRCFQCSIGLRNWEAEDDPWVEHARWYPRCTFVLEKKGQRFIDAVQEAAMNANREAALQENNARHNIPTVKDLVEADSSKTTAVKNGKAPSEEERKNPLLCHAAQSVLEMGYLPRVVKKAADRILKVDGWSAMKGRNLMKVILELEEEGELDGKSSLIPANRHNYDSLEMRKKSYNPQTVNKHKLKEEITDMKDAWICMTCFDNKRSIVFLPCGHLVTCAICAPAMKTCPMCRAPIKATVKVNLPE